MAPDLLGRVDWDSMDASSIEAKEVRVGGTSLRCQVCDYTRFYAREAHLSTGASVFFGQDWAHSNATCYICEQCGYVHWFVRTRAAASSIEDSTLGQEIEALRRRIEAEEPADAEVAQTR